MLGNFCGDFVKGHDWKKYPGDIQTGLLLHRRIDDFTDHHSLVKEAKQLFLPHFHPYAGVLTDIFFDGLLARDFTAWSGRDLGGFASDFYALAHSRQEELPEYARHVLVYMERDNWLCRYQTIEGLTATLRGMTRRTGNRVPLFEAVAVFEAHLEEIEVRFRHFFPELIQFTQQELLQFSHDFSS